jgi:hypothetical protein
MFDIPQQKKVALKIQCCVVKVAKCKLEHTNTNSLNISFANREK